MARLEEEHFFFDAGGRRLYGFLHRPAPPAEAPEAGLVFLDPWGEEKVRNHRLLVNLARGLAGAGCPVLRFDFFGYGDSAGDFEEAVLGTMVDDARGALSLLRDRCGVRRAGLLGPRFGGAVALEACLEHRAADFLVLADPVLDARAYFFKLLRSNLTSQLLVHDKVVRDREQLVADLERGGSVNIDGYLLSSAFYLSVRDLNFFEDARAGRNLPPTLLLEISARESGPSQKPARFAEKWTSTPALLEFRSVDLPILWEGQKTYCPHPAALLDAIVRWLPQVAGAAIPSLEGT
jgi:alpha/beta superfamily hydrolase